MKHLLHPSIAQLTLQKPENHSMMVIHYPIHYGWSTSRSLPNDYATVASLADTIDYCYACLARSHCALKCLLSHDVTRYIIINQRQISSEPLSPENSCRPSNRSLRRSVKGGNPSLALFCLKTGALFATTGPSRIHIIWETYGPRHVVQVTVVPGKVAKPHPQREWSLL